MTFRRGILCCLMSAALIGSLPLQAGELITGFAISGLKRTKLGVVEKVLQKFLGQEADQLDLNEVQAVIINMGILEPLRTGLEAALEGDGMILTIAVREKWSLLPLPVVWLGSEGMGAGGFFVDTNALGLNDKFFTGGMYRTTGWMAGGGYVHTSQRKRFPGWQTTAVFSREERHDTDQSNHDIRRFSLDSINASLGITYPFREIFTGSLHISYHRMMLRDNEDPLAVPESGASLVGIGGNIKVRKNHWDGYLLSQESASLEYTFAVGIASPSFHTLKFTGIYEKSLIPGFRLNLRTGLVYSPGVPPLSETGPAAAQVTILPTSFAAQHYAGATLGIEKHLFTLSFGSFSVLASYQLVYSYGPLLGSAFDHGVGGTLSFYMSKLAIPALGLGIAYNLAARYIQTSFSAGMSF